MDRTVADERALAAAERPWRALGKTFRQFLRRLPAGSRLTVVAESGPDGVAAGAILGRALGRAGWRVAMVFPGPGQTAWDGPVLDRLAATGPAALLALGVGVPSTDPAVPVPVLLIDHRPLAGVPPGWTAVSAADWGRPVSTAVLAYWLGREVFDVSRLDWVAALGAMATLGEGVEQPLVVAAKRAHGTAWLHDLLALLRAAGRAADPIPEAAAHLLALARDPKEALTGGRPEQVALVTARDEVEAEIERCRALLPLAEEPVTLVRLDSACAVQGVLAAVWAGRRPGRPALVGNIGRLPGRVALAAVAPPDSDLLDRLRAALAPAADFRADEATLGEPFGGHLPTADWLATLERLGVPTGVPRRGR